MSQQSQSPLDQHQNQIEQWVAQRKSNTQIAEALRHEFGISSSERSIRRARKRWKTESPVDRYDEPEAPSTSIRGDEADIVGRAELNLGTPESLMEERGLDPKEWEVVSMTINEWMGATAQGGGSKQTGKHMLKQLKIHLRRIIPMTLIAPARTDGPTFSAPRVPLKDKEEPKRFVLCGDQQAPFQNEELHWAFLNFLGDYQPHSGILIGDTIDLPDISRHPNNPEKDVSVQECVDSAYLLLRDYREAWQLCDWQKLAGNHDERLRRLQIEKVERIYGLRRAAIPGELLESPVMDVGHLLRLDELDIEYIRPDGDYEHTQVKLSPLLGARHGWIATQKSGTSALKTLEHLGHSIIVGHSHRQSLVFKSWHDIDGNLTTLTACETGCMCQIEGGLGYAPSPNWQNGLATAEVWPDGRFKIDLATFVDGVLYYRDKRY